jgi:hypothetical protein
MQDSTTTAITMQTDTNPAASGASAVLQPDPSTSCMMAGNIAAMHHCVTFGRRCQALTFGIFHRLSLFGRSDLLLLESMHYWPLRDT